MSHLKTSTVPVIMGALGMIRKETKYLGVLAYVKYKKLFYAELLIFLGEYCQFDWKSMSKYMNGIQNKCNR